MRYLAATQKGHIVNPKDQDIFIHIVELSYTKIQSYWEQLRWQEVTLKIQALQLSSRYVTAARRMHMPAKQQKTKEF